MSGRREGRFELKYAIPVGLRERLLELVQDDVRSDEHARPLPCGGRGYPVHSLYYDTAHNEQPTFDDYFDRLAERNIRDRLRIRTYGWRGDAEQPVFLENKRKLDDRVVKHRVRVCNTEEWYQQRSQQPWQTWRKRIPPRGRHAFRNFDRMVRIARRPVSVVHYVREVFIDNDPAQTQVRLTIDREVTATIRPKTLDLYASPDVDLLPRDWMVLEMKFDGDRPVWMRRLCRKLSLQASPVSKFGLSVALGFRADHPRELRYFTPHPLRRRNFIMRPALHVFEAEAR